MRRLLALAVLGLLIIVLQPAGWAIVPGPTPIPPPVGSQPPNLPDPPPDPGLPTFSTVGTLLDQPDSTQTEVTFANKVVTVVLGSLCFYMQEYDRSSGIRVQCSGSVSVQPGNRVTVTGHVGTTSWGERYLNADPEDCAVTSGSFVPAPLAMDNLTVGGNDLNEYTQGIDYRDEREYLELTGGCYNLGLLLKTWGRVVATDDENWVELDDGTNFCRPIRVNGVVADIGDRLIVTGISSCFSWTSGENTYRRPLILIRDGNAVEYLDSITELTSPAGTIAAPPTGQDFAHNLISIPNVAYGPAPWQVFAATLPALEDTQTVSGSLIKWRTTAPQVFDDSYYAYRDQGTEGVRFGPIYSGQGYWIRSVLSGEICYSARTGSIETTDRFIRLPYGIDSNDDGGFTLIGLPFQDKQLLANLSITDGNHVVSMADAIAMNWVDNTLWWWDSANQQQKTVKISGGDDTYLWPWRGYWIRTFRDKLALIIPASSSELLLTATSDSAEVSLTWTESNMNNLAAYKVYRTDYSGNYSPTPIATTDAPLRSYTDHDASLIWGKRYYYIVKPTDGSTDGDPSNEAYASLTGDGLIVTPEEDEAVFTGRPKIPYGDEDLGNVYMGGLFVGRSPTMPKEDIPSGNARCYLKFTLQTLPTGAVISTASLNMYCNKMIQNGMAPDVAVYRLSGTGSPDPDDNWQEGTLTDELAQQGIDTCKGENPEDHHTVAARGWQSWDVTEAVSDERVSDGVLTLVVEAQTNWWLYFVEKEFDAGTNRSFLKIAYH